ncbi:hypothetical protein B0T26DRAFT_680467 [Lasiosphaeria miniovina]|uniref:CID domain-containing protein n=1 Tax=Lasiosphaeria miniovina TaxID=1954250 RepID=A0AA40A054_9PEZI|nr:uncharacterized protein B0T26DRAFT_680467 [Lasiosphaeria miniovina]KAK0706842.1 hypothetical protein B0T26DRAFT_680467 [Lasiosphaeria miniovina]
MADNAADVAEDYRQALEDLTINSRIEISTLANIARENANHGLAITEVLQNHIKKVPPGRTLPALYVLDSVVKNAPTPYALYFGPKLYSVFMGAYTKVDNMTRRKMEEMLRTWKEPVPGSISSRPVFPPEHVQPIENALVAAHNAALAAQQNNYQGTQQLLRSARPSAPNRDTPTPPMARAPSHHQAGPHGHQPFPGPNGQPQYHNDLAMAQQPYPVLPLSANVIPTRAPPQAPPPAGPFYGHQQPAGRDVYGAPQPGISIDKLKDDIQHLIVAAKAEFAQDPLDTSKQTRLKALLDLQTLIQRQDMPQDQLMVVKDKVAELAVNMRAPSAAPLSMPMPYAYAATPPVVVSQQPTPVPPVAVARPPPPAAAPPSAVSFDGLFGQGALATLLGGLQKPATPQTPRSVDPAAQPAVSSLSANPSALLAMLRQSGLLAAGAPAAGAAPAPPQPASSAAVGNISSLLSQARPFAAAPAPSGHGSEQLQAASLKQFRPQLIAQFHDDLGPPCTQCGRRFCADEQGRRKKTAHMDWHFRVHQRIAEAEKRGQHRSWYVDEMDWIKSREAIDVDYVAPDLGGSSSNSGDGDDGNQAGGDYYYAVGGSGGRADSSSARQPVGAKTSNKNSKKIHYIAVPDDPGVNTTCPICQERFEMKWLDEAQEWVWMDAVWVPASSGASSAGAHPEQRRVYHATCHREVGGGSAPQQAHHFARATPELDEFNSLRGGKLKMEGY